MDRMWGATRFFNVVSSRREMSFMKKKTQCDLWCYSGEESSYI